MIEHALTLEQPDSDETGIVHPSEWNAPHVITGLLGLIDRLAAQPGSFPALADDGSPFMQSLSEPARAMLAAATKALMLSSVGAAPLSSPSLTDVPTAPTAGLGTSSEQLATTRFVSNAVAALVSGSPELLNTLNELAMAVGNDPHLSVTLTTAIANRVRVDGVQSFTTEQKTQALANLGVVLGLAANNVLQLDANARLPALDASKLINVPIPNLLTFADLASFRPTVDPDYVRVLSAVGLQKNFNEDWLGKKVSAAPAHSNWKQTASGAIYERVPASPRVPASLTEIGASIGPDCTPFLNKAIEQQLANGFDNWILPEGVWWFNSQPNPLPGSFYLQGAGIGRTLINRKFVSTGGTASGVFQVRASVGGKSGQGVRLSDFSIQGLKECQSGGVGTGCLISIDADADHTAGWCFLERLNITNDLTGTTGANTAYNLVLYGYERFVSGGPGTRSTYINNCQIFGAEYASVWINGCVHAYWQGGGCYPAGGKKGGLLLSNDGAFRNNSIRLVMGACDGDLSIYQTDNSLIDCASVSGNVFIDDSCSGVAVVAPFIGGTQYVGNPASNRLVTRETLARLGGSAHHAYLPNGALIQWGVTTGVGDSYQVINFPVPFSGNPSVTPVVLGADTVKKVALGSVGSSAFSVAIEAGTESVSWTAVGPA